MCIGPFIRMFDAHFTLEDALQSIVTLAVEGADGYRLESNSSMSAASATGQEKIPTTHHSLTR